MSLNYVAVYETQKARWKEQTERLERLGYSVPTFLTYEDWLEVYKEMLQSDAAEQ